MTERDPHPAPRVSEAERLRRWRLVLGADGAPTEPGSGQAVGVEGDDARIDAVLAALYDSAATDRRGRSRAGGLGRSAPGVARWLGDVRRYFPAPVVQVLQRDAIDRLDLRRMLLEPEMLAAVEPDVHLAATLVELSRLLPDESRATARAVVGRVIDDLQRRFAERTRAAIAGALARPNRTRRPRPGDIDWLRTIEANLRTWQPAERTLIPERLVGYGRHRRGLARDVIVAVDQSASMADSVVYAALFAAVLASMPTLRTRVVAFDTSVVDLTSLAADPVELLFGVQLGGGTDIGQALAYCQQLVERPAQTVIVLVTDLYEGGASGPMLARAAALARSGVTVITLLALSDDGAPAYDHALAEQLAALGIPAFACTPGAFPDLLAAALRDGDVVRAAAKHEVVAAAPLAG
jgi:Mg-chelatase subunit ChlD